MDRAYSTLEIKSSHDGEGTFEGLASTPSLDTQGDIMEPAGAQFRTPLPLLWQHNAREPIGEVISARVTDAGIYVKAKVLRITDPGKLKDRLDEAWQSIRYGLVKGLSIGFTILESEPIRGSRGKHIKAWSWRELSAVTMPANVEASILNIKRADLADMQRLGLVPAPDMHASTDMTVKALLAELGSDRCLVELRDGGLHVELLDASKSTPGAAMPAGVVTKAFLKQVMGQIMTELGTKSSESRLALMDEIDRLKHRVQQLERR